MNYYTTDSLALCPFLDMNGLKFVKSELAIGKYDKPVVQFVFEDPKGVGKDLEREYIRSNEKRYRDLGFFYRNEIEKLKRRIDKAQLDERRKDDDKHFNKIEE